MDECKPLDLGSADLSTVQAVSLRGLVHFHGSAALRAYAILAGCDYDCHCRRIGVKKALIITGLAGVDVADIVAEVEENHELGLSPGQHWGTSMHEALDCFLHPIVYDLATCTQRALSNEDVSGKPHLGVVCDPAQAAGRALGTVHPTTGEDVDMPPIEQLVMDTEPVRLTLEMVAGSVSPFVPFAALCERKWEVWARRLPGSDARARSCAALSPGRSVVSHDKRSAADRDFSMCPYMSTVFVL